MFGWLKKRLIRRMLGLTDAAQMVVASALLNHYSHDSSIPADHRAARAAAGANYLFGKDTDVGHASQFDLSKLQAEVTRWLQANEAFKKLVVQSLRVLNTATYATAGAGPVIGEAVLSTFGRDYPDAPDPQTFEASVHGTLQHLPTKDRESIRSWMRRTGR